MAALFSFQALSENLKTCFLTMCLMYTLFSRSFWGFADHFKDQADALLDKLDPAKRKALQGELSNSSSSNSVNSNERLSANRLRARSASQDRGYETSTLG